MGCPAVSAGPGTGEIEDQRDSLKAGVAIVGGVDRVRRIGGELAGELDAVIPVDRLIEKAEKRVAGIVGRVWARHAQSVTARNRAKNAIRRTGIGK